MKRHGQLFQRTTNHMRLSQPVISDALCVGRPEGGVLARFLRDDAGVTSIEYGLIAALAALAAIPALNTLGEKLGGTFAAVAEGLDGPPEAAPAPPAYGG